MSPADSVTAAFSAARALRQSSVYARHARLRHVSVLIDKRADERRQPSDAAQGALPIDSPQRQSAPTRQPAGSVPSSIASVVETAEHAHSQAANEPDKAAVEEPTPRAQMSMSKVPSSRLGRLMHYGGLAASLSYGAASEYVRRGSSISDSRSVFMSEANVRRLVDKLSKMRGAALKLGQFLSIQDTQMLPPQIEAVLQEVQARANYMPPSQLDAVMRADLGSEWRSEFADFADQPVAAASIGQVHRAKLASSGEDVAVKVQFPGVQESIESDLGYLRWLLLASAVLPRGLFLDASLDNFKRELADECDYVREGEAMQEMRENILSSGDEMAAFAVPKVHSALTSPRVLTAEWMNGEPLTKATEYPQELRDWIGTSMLRLCLHELFSYSLMQTDPNWSNFLYDRQRRQLALIDFGATRRYDERFMSVYRALLLAAIRQDRDECHRLSKEIGYLTGEESEAMVRAHLTALDALSEPFRCTGTFDFAKDGRRASELTRSQIPLMLRERLKPPPPETYSLNRKLSGVFLLCERLGSRVDTSSIAGMLMLNANNLD